jgi:acyl-CoA synthetase (AMP-forming)/AMP-acid ligase II
MTAFKDVFERYYTWLEGYMRNVRRFADKPAMIDPDTERSWTYRELDQACNQLSHALHADGTGHGSVVMLMLGNCPEFAFSYIAAQKNGAVCCPVNFRISAGELAYCIDDSRPSVLMYGAEFRDTVLQALELAEHRPARLVTVDGAGTEESVSYEEYTAGQATTPFEPDFEYSTFDETSRLYTSGTTGRPKAVPMTSINEVLSAHDVMIHFPMSYRDVTVNTTPWFHRGGLHCAGPCPAFYAGASIVILRKFDAATTLRYVARYGITFIVGVPTVLEALADVQEKQGQDISCLKGIVTMGSPLEREACIRYQRILTPNIFNGYGTTETFWNTFLRPFDLPSNAGTAGASCVDDDVRVVKIFEDRRAEPDELAATDGSEVGEVIICSPAKSPYLYSNNPDQTEEKYHKGFLYTHDLATWDKNQFITIIGRMDDMIISSGENIYPTEIESVLNKHDKVKDCMVTSVPDKIRGQIVTAYIVRADDSLTCEEMDEYCKQSPEVANFKRPRYYRFVSQIPFNATGKKLHVKMKEIALEDLKNGLLYRV